jgi:hypothetical protein
MQGHSPAETSDQVLLLLSSFFFLLGSNGTSSTITEATTGLLHQLWMIGDDECEAVSGMIGRGNGSTRRKLAQVSLCPPQIPHNVNRAWTRAAAVGSRRLTAWATAQTAFNWARTRPAAVESRRLTAWAMAQTAFNFSWMLVSREVSCWYQIYDWPVAWPPTVPTDC